MRKFFLVLGTFLSTTLIVDIAMAESTMRCGRNLVSRGDSPGEVLAQCGEPVYTSQRTIYRSGVARPRIRTLSIGNASFTESYSTVTDSELLSHNRSVVEVPVDVWTFNFGPRYFMREVTFMDGRVTTIKTLGYGN